MPCGTRWGSARSGSGPFRAERDGSRHQRTPSVPLLEVVQQTEGVHLERQVHRVLHPAGDAIPELDGSQAPDQADQLGGGEVRPQLRRRVPPIAAQLGQLFVEVSAVRGQDVALDFSHDAPRDREEHQVEQVEGGAAEPRRLPVYHP